MLDTETKRRIDAARDILVGKVPDPKSQVEQITIALIYKFMDDMDAQAEELGGTRTFFAGEFEKYSWAKLMRVGSSGHEVLNLYAEAITRMTQNANLPSLFREIFKNAYLPYRDPETLKQFLKIINEFAYDHSERLGDAFEYLLAVLGSQGDAGQFRTPRHIIDFMAALLDPQKNESLLDPACGTAGFLISAYKHIWNANARDGRPGAALSPAERARLVGNIKGYDISPDMVRLSLVNLYLHGFAEPHIFEYDTLTSEDKWNEHADLIMANPPFMSPKGGIRPHKRFSVQSNRSEVLFVDYIAEHLTANGRAAVIVPEGIIFQSGKAYKALRKMLVEKYLVGVISLPAGVFNPYSGVKTSILWLDKTLALKTNEIVFVKIENDGFDLGAQRRESKRNDLPDALENLQRYKRALSSGEKFVADGISNLSLVVKARIAENGDYNLSGERYKISIRTNAYFPVVTLGEIILRKPEYGSSAKKEKFDGKVRYIRITDIGDDGRLKDDDIVSPSKIESEYFLKEGDLLFARSGSVGRCYIHQRGEGTYQFAGYLIRFNIDESKALPKFIFYLTKSTRYQEWIAVIKKDGTISNINAQEYSSFSFPLPSLVVQQEIVAEIEGYQKIIDGARQVVENYQPRIEIEPEWEMVRLGDVATLTYGYTETAQEHGDTRFVRITDIDEKGKLREENAKYVTLNDEMKGYSLRRGDLLVARTGATFGKTLLFDSDSPSIYASYLIKIDFEQTRVLPKYYWIFTLSESYEAQKMRLVTGGGQPQFNSKAIQQIHIPLPDLATQQRIVARIEREQALVQANRELIALFEEKIRARIARVWGEA